MRNIHFESLRVSKITKYLNACIMRFPPWTSAQAILKENTRRPRKSWSATKQVHDTVGLVKRNMTIRGNLFVFSARIADVLLKDYYYRSQQNLQVSSSRLPQDLDLGLDGGHDGLLIFLTVYAALCLLFWKMRILDYFECKKSAKEAILIERMIIVHIDASLWTRRWIQWFLVILNQH